MELNSNQSPIAQYIIGMDHQIRSWNRACELLTGYPASEMIGTDRHWEPFYPEKRPVMADFLVDGQFDKIIDLYKNKNVRKSEIVPGAWEASSSYRGLGGKPRCIQWLATPLYDSTGKITGALTYLQDITERRSWEMMTSIRNFPVDSETICPAPSLQDRYRFGSLIGKSRAMQRIYDLIIRAADTTSSVIVYGESGSGKELVSRAIHDLSDRKNKNFVAVNCAAITETLMESEFFGHVKGAFTGATHEKSGYLDRAHGGTLFLDEVGDLGLNMQVKLLRVLEGGEYLPVGSNQNKRADVRIIAATNKALPEMVRNGRMREDFFYRIDIIPIRIPPLRDHIEDLPLLIEHFLKKFKPDAEMQHIPGHDIEVFYNYHWPGNIRELQNVLLRYLTLEDISFSRVQKEMPSIGEVCPLSEPGKFTDLRCAIQNYEKKVIVEALDRNRWQRSQTALELGISRKTLFRKMNHHDLI